MDRCRIVVIVEPSNQTLEIAKVLTSAGDIASIILLSGDYDGQTFAERASNIVPVFQEAEIAVLISNDSQLVGRCDADGIFLEGDRQQYKEQISRFSPQKIAGCGNIKDRHGALEIGEMKPDFLFFGKPNGDIKEVAHPKNMALADWWADMVEIPGILMAGSSIESVIDCSATGTEFVALNRAIFEHQNGPEAAIRMANDLLDKHAPNLDVEDD